MTTNVSEFPWQPVPDFLAEIRPDAAALVVVDMQYFAAHPDYGICTRLRKAGPPTTFEYFSRRLSEIIPRIATLVEVARRTLAQVIFTRVQSVTPDGRGRSYFHEYLGLNVAPGSKEAGILDDLKPAATDIVISKTGGGSFYGTNLDYVLRNMKVEGLLICGVTTAGCVETTVREAADRSYKVVLIEDACASYWDQEHEAAIAAMGIRHACVRKADAVLQVLDSLTAGAAAVPYGERGQ